MVNAPFVTVSPKNETANTNTLYLQVVNVVEGETLVMKEYSGITLQVEGLSQIFTDNAGKSVITLTAGLKLTWNIPIVDEAKAQIS